MEFHSARRATENSPAIHRWGTDGTDKVPEGRQNAWARTRGSKVGFLSSQRDFSWIGFSPSVSIETLGYFRSSLWDFNPHSQEAQSNLVGRLKHYLRPNGAQVTKFVVETVLNETSPLRLHNDDETRTADA